MPVLSLRPLVVQAIFAATVAVASLAACTPAEELPAAAAAPVTPLPTGHGVGRSELAWTDASRSDADTPSGKRELRGWLYYPTAQAPAIGGVALDGAWAEAYRPSLERRLGVAAAKAVLATRWHASDAPAAPGRFPVLVFAHGYHQLPTNYSALLEGLASRGYDVLAIASPGIAEVVPIAGNRMAPNLPLDDRSYDTMAKDIASAIGELPTLDASTGSAYAGHLDLDRVGVFGHSVGGAAAVLASARLPQLRAAANLDGDYAGASAVEQPRVPLLYVTSQPPDRPAQPKSDWDTERNEVRRDRLWRHLASRSPRALRVRVGGMFHANFQDSALLSASAMPRKLRENRYGSIDGARGLDLTVRLLAAFFAETLGGTSKDGVQAVVRQFPEADVQVLTRVLDRSKPGSKPGSE